MTKFRYFSLISLVVALGASLDAAAYTSTKGNGKCDPVKDGNVFCCQASDCGLCRSSDSECHGHAGPFSAQMSTGGSTTKPVVNLYKANVPKTAIKQQ